MRRSNGGFLEFLSLLFVYGGVSRIMQVQRASKEFFTNDEEMTIERKVSIVNLVVMIVAICAFIYQMGAFGIIMGIISCFAIYCLNQLVIMLVVIKNRGGYWKLFYCLLFLTLVFFCAYTESVKVLLGICTFIGLEFIIVNFMLKKYSKKQCADVRTDSIDNRIASNDKEQMIVQKGECHAQSDGARNGLFLVSDDGLVKLLRGVSLSERLRYLNVDSVGELIEKFPTCTDDDDLIDFRYGEKSVVGAKRKVVADKYRYMPADFNPNLVVPAATAAAVAAPVAMYYDDDDGDEESSFWDNSNVQEQTPEQKPAWQDPYAYHGTEKYDAFYNLREDEYREEYGEDFEDAIDDEYEETYINK